MPSNQHRHIHRNWKSPELARQPVPPGIDAPSGGLAVHHTIPRSVLLKFWNCCSKRQQDRLVEALGPEPGGAKVLLNLPSLLTVGPLPADRADEVPNLVVTRKGRPTIQIPQFDGDSQGEELTPVSSRLFTAWTMMEPLMVQSPDGGRRIDNEVFEDTLQALIAAEAEAAQRGRSFSFDPDLWEKMPVAGDAPPGAREQWRKKTRDPEGGGTA